MTTVCHIISPHGADEMAYSNSQKEATARYNKKAYDRIEIKVKKGRKDEIVAFSRRKGAVSVNSFIVSLIDKAMNEEDA